MASSSSEPGMKSEGSGGGGEALEAVATADQLQLYRGLKKAKKERGCTAKERISKMPPCAAGKRSSIYRGVTRHRWTGRYEAHLWDKSTWNQNQNKKGKQVYLGAYDDEEAAARAYDLAALKYWGPGTLINFPVTDYSRDLEEMQSLSREEYLASLRRKSNGFSRGISKYRGLSSRWDSSFGRMGGPEYFNSMKYGAGAGEDPAIDSNFGASFSLDRKIDLTSYIKWWGPNRSRRVDSAAKSYQDTKFSSSEDAAAAAAGELRPSECAAEYTEPYQMPRLGIMSRERKKHKGGSMISALTILSQSASFKSLQEKASKKQEPEKENHNKNTITRTTDYGKDAVEKPTSHDDGGGSERQLGISGGLSVHRNSYPLPSFLNAPLLTSYNTIEPLVDPVLWSSLLPGLPPPGLPRAATEVPKTETTTSTYTYIQPQE